MQFNGCFVSPHCETDLWQFETDFNTILKLLIRNNHTITEDNKCMKYQEGVREFLINRHNLRSTNGSNTLF